MLTTRKALVYEEKDSLSTIYSDFIEEQKEKIIFDAMSSVTIDDRNDRLIDGTHSGRETDKLLFRPNQSQLLLEISRSNYLDSSKYISYKTLYDNVTSDNSINTINKKLPLKDILDLVNDAYKTSQNRFYGVLIRKSGKEKFFNPLHPLIANAMMLTKTDMDTPYEVIIYSSNVYMKHNEDILSREKQNIIDILSAMEIENDNLISRVENINFRKMHHNLILTYDAYDKDDKLIVDEQNNYFIVPNQIINKSIIAPYYGTSLIYKNNLVSGSTLTSLMRSANISNNSEFSRICTGGHGEGLDGLRTLSHSNLKSPLNSNSIHRDAWNLVMASIEISLSIFGYEYETIIKKEQTRIDYAEWSKIEGNDSIQQYIEMLQEIKSKEI